MLLGIINRKGMKLYAKRYKMRLEIFNYMLLDMIVCGSWIQGLCRTLIFNPFRGEGVGCYFATGFIRGYSH